MHAIRALSIFTFYSYELLCALKASNWLILVPRGDFKSSYWLLDNPLIVKKSLHDSQHGLEYENPQIMNLN